VQSSRSLPPLRGINDPDHLVYSPDYLDIARSNEVIFVQITLSSGRDAAKKQAFYARVVELLNQRPKVRPEDVVIKLSEEPTGRLVVRKRRGPIHRATAGEVEVGRVGLRRDNPL
jgi:Tautomerase enzyme